MVGPEDPHGEGAEQRTPYDATYQHEGDEISSTLEGRHVNIYEDLLVHPAHADGLVNKGDPVLAGWSLVGIALNSASSTNDVITIETEGVWYLSVTSNLQGMGAIWVGDMVYIDPVTAAIGDDFTYPPFGHALGPVASGATELIAVKVHAYQVLFPWWLFFN